MMASLSMIQTCNRRIELNTTKTWKSWNKTSQVNVNSDLWWKRGAGSNLKCKSRTLTKSQLSGQLLGITLFGRILKAGLRFILLKMTPPKIYFTWRDLPKIYISWCDAAKIYFHWSFDFRSAAPLDSSAKKKQNHNFFWNVTLESSDSMRLW